MSFSFSLDAPPKSDAALDEPVSTVPEPPPDCPRSSVFSLSGSNARSSSGSALHLCGGGGGSRCLRSLGRGLRTGLQLGLRLRLHDVDASLKVRAILDDDAGRLYI